MRHPAGISIDISMPNIYFYFYFCRNMFSSEKVLQMSYANYQYVIKSLLQNYTTLT